MGSFLPAIVVEAASVACKSSTISGPVAEADGWLRNEAVYLDLLEKMCLIIALIIRLIWKKEKSKEHR